MILPLTATVRARGYLWIEFDISGPDQKPDWRFCRGEISEMLKDQYCIMNPQTFEANAHGVFSGVEATSYKVTTKTLDTRGIVISTEEYLFQRGNLR